jgi:hypothetical protein
MNAHSSRSHSLLLKPNIGVTKSKEHKNTLAKYDVEVTESLRRINQLISKI